MPKISVIMAAHNSEKYLEDAINSVIRQTEADFELIVVNDGSTDTTAAILEDYSNEDARIRCVHRAQASGGPTQPKNLALSLARGKYLSFLDHDDMLHPEKLARLSQGLDEHPEWVATFSDLQLVDAAGYAHEGTYLSNASFQSELPALGHDLGHQWWDLGTDFYAFMSLRYAGFHTDSVMLARARLLDDPPSFRKHYNYSDDTDLWLRVGAQGSVGYLDIPLAYYRMHESNLSANTPVMAELALALHRANRLLATQRLSKAALQQYDKKISDLILENAWHQRKSGNLPAARELYLNALRRGRIASGLQGIAKTLLEPMLKRTS